MATESKVLNRAELPKLRLYSYWRSSCSHRVRIALNLKGLEYEYKAVNLLKNEQSSPEFVKLNPLKFVPALVDGETLITDSLAISLYLDDKYPEHPLLPRDSKNKAFNLQVQGLLKREVQFGCLVGIFCSKIASIVGSSIQPLQNLAVLNYIEKKMGSDEKFTWAKYHINNGFEVETTPFHVDPMAIKDNLFTNDILTLELLLKDVPGKYATGDEPQLADIFLAPQIVSGKRFQIDMSRYPTLARLNQAYDGHPAFRAALPANQPDAVA